MGTIHTYFKVPEKILGEIFFNLTKLDAPDGGGKKFLSL